MTNALIAEKLAPSARSTASKAIAGTSTRSGVSNPGTGNRKGGVIKTVVLPHEDFNKLALEGQMLAAFLKQQEQLFQDTVNAYQKDRSVRMQEFDLKQRDFAERQAELQVRLEDRKQLNYQIQTEYFNYRHAVEKAKLSLEDQIRLAKVENESLKEAMGKVLEDERADEEYSETLYAQKTEQFAARFRKSTQKNE